MDQLALLTSRSAPWRPVWRVLAVALVLVCAGLVLAVMVARYCERATIEELRLAGTQRLDSHALALEQLLTRYEVLPRTLELEPQVIALLEQPHQPSLREPVNAYLEQLNRLFKASSIYIVDVHGQTQAASNWRTPDSFVGDQIGFRPYVRDALLGMPGGFYGVGTTRGEPGYFFAHGIYHHGRLLGVAAVKVNITQMERGWAQGGNMLMLADAHGVIFLSSVSVWKYRTLTPLAPGVLQLLDASRQYGGRRLPSLGLRTLYALDQGASIVSAPAPAPQAPLLLQRRTLAPRSWQFIYLSDLTPAVASARNGFLLTILSEALLALWLLYLAQRRRARYALQTAYDDLEHKVALRTASLQQLTQELSAENGVRRNAEQQLRLAQTELVQAGKMAVLGQMAAGISHELNQPLTALRTLSDNARVLIERGRLSDAEDNLSQMAQLVERMGALTGQLRQFAYKAQTSVQPVTLAPAITAALFLVERRLAQERVNFHMAMQRPDLQARCDGNRLQQVLVNLYTNALDAMAGCALRELSVSASADLRCVTIVVSDTGAGITAAVHSRLFEPFFTTKPPGQGLGLGLAISEQIVRECGGRLQAEAGTDGTRFLIELPLVQSEST